MIPRQTIDRMNTWHLAWKGIDERGQEVHWFIQRFDKDRIWRVRASYPTPQGVVIGQVTPISKTDGWRLVEIAKCFDRSTVSPDTYPPGFEGGWRRTTEEPDLPPTWPIDPNWFDGELHEIEWTQEREFLRSRLTFLCSGHEVKVHRSHVKQRDGVPWFLFQCDPLILEETPWLKAIIDKQNAAG